MVGDTPIVIDYSATPSIMGLTRCLTEYGFNVKTIYSDVFRKDERKHFEKLKELRPDIEVYPTMDPAMRFLDNKYESEMENNSSHNEQEDGKIVAIGQKAAYFVHTPYFVNIADGGGMYGLDGIKRMAEEIMDAFKAPKDTRKLISHKGIGCASCL